MDAPEGFKQCPDCAEMVREQARKCRFCGYRFDGEPGSQAAKPAVKGEPSSVRELLAEWGNELQEGEHVAFFVHAHAHGVQAAPNGIVDGFLLITDRRLAFFAPKRRGLLRREKQPGATVVVEQPHGRPGGASVQQRRFRRPELQLDRAIALRGIERSTLRDIEAFLAERTPS